MLINKKLLAQYSPYPINYDFSEVNNYINLSEIIWILPIIGQEFYDELEEQVKNNNLSDENGTLLAQALYPYLGFAVALESLPMAWSHFSAVGITKGKSDNSDSVSLKDMTYIESHLRKQVEARKDFFIQFLNDHYTSYPKYNPSNCGCESSCCSKKGKLNEPQPYFQIYGFKKICTDIR